MPKISVLTPIYNTDASHLREMIESVLNQTYGDFEFIILNDSPDNSSLKDIVLSYGDERIRYCTNEVNLGISESRNRLLDLASGEYVAVLDHDDVCYPSRFEKQVAYLDGHPEVGVCSSWFLEMLSNGLYKPPSENIDIKRTLMRENCVPHTAMMIRKSVLDDCRVRYEAQYSPAEDYMICIRLMPYTMFHNIEEPLVKYRSFDGNTSSRQRQKMLDRDLMIKAIAYSNYGYISNNEACVRTRKIILFGFIPLWKDRWVSPTCKWVYLFGFIPVAKISHRR